MVDSLLGAEDSEPMRWMLYPQLSAEEQRSFLDGRIVDSSQSVRSFVSLADAVMSCYEHELSMFRSMPYCRTERYEEIIDGRRVRQVGGGELLWLAKNTHVLNDAPAGTGMVVSGRRVTPKKLQTGTMRKCLDSQENRSVIAFLREVVSRVIDVEGKAREAVERLEDTATRLEDVSRQEGLLLSLVVVQACIAAEKPQIEKLKALRQRGTRLLRSYNQALPGVAEISYRIPRRTKVFQEVRSYVLIYRLMEQWSRFGYFDMVRDGLVLSIRRMDKLYEYYALYELLSGLYAEGYEPDCAEEDAFTSVVYTLDAPYFSNEKSVANRYMLRCGDRRVALYYQPVLYGDEREEGGIVLHRTTPRYAFGDADADSYWTPDFLLIVREDDHTVSTVIFDAKFMRMQDAAHFYEKGSEFTKCLNKYKSEVDSADGHGVDALWLLCGREERRIIKPFQVSSWARHNRGILPDGMVSVSPKGNCIAELLELMKVKRRPSTTQSENANEEDAITNGALAEKGTSVQSEANRETFSEEKQSETASPVQMLKDVYGGNKEESNTIPEPQKQEAVNDVPAPGLVASPSSKRELQKEEIAPDILKAICEVCSLTVDKKQFTTTRASATLLGFSHPLLRTVVPEGRERKLYTSKPLSVDGREVFVYKQWLPMNAIKLRSLQKNLKKKAAQTASNPDELGR